VERLFGNRVRAGKEEMGQTDSRNEEEMNRANMESLRREKIALKMGTVFFSETLISLSTILHSVTTHTNNLVIVTAVKTLDKWHVIGCSMHRICNNASFLVCYLNVDCRTHIPNFRVCVYLAPKLACGHRFCGKGKCSIMDQVKFPLPDET
jgi:hypothetical protein